MRIAFDENMPPAVVRALQVLVASENAGAREAIEVLHALDLAARGTGDVPLIHRIADGAIGKAALVTADRRQRTRAHERRAFEDAGVVGIVLARQWNQAPMWTRAQLVLAWWFEWIRTIDGAAPGTVWSCPYAQKPRRMSQGIR